MIITVKDIEYFALPVYNVILRSCDAVLTAYVSW